MTENDSSHADRLARALGEEIRFWRQRRRLTRPELAALVGISDTTMGRVERDGPNGVSDMWRMADALGISFADLVRRAEEASRLAEDAHSLGAVASTETEIEGAGEDSI